MLAFTSNIFIIIMMIVIIIIIRPRRCRSAAACSRQTFPWTICRSVGPCVGPSISRSVCPVHCGKTADRIRMPFGIIGRTGPGMRQVVRFGEGILLGANLGRAIVTNGDFTAYTLSKLVIIIIIIPLRSTAIIRIIFSVKALKQYTGSRLK